MSVEDDIARVAEQERRCVFTAFDETTALKIGMRIAELAAAKGAPLAIDIRFWNRPLYFYAMPGSSADNVEWVRRKSNCVRRFNRASYAVSLKQARDGKGFAHDSGVDSMEIAAHGGAFPIRMAGTGIIGTITVSGVPQRMDHAYVVEAVCDHLGIDYASLALAAA